MSSEHIQGGTLNTVKLNAEYASTLGAYWMIYAIAGSFASVFMLAKGYTNMHIGITLAAANLLALALQPFIADRMDRIRGIKIIDASATLTVLMMLAGAGYFIFTGGSLMLAVSIVLVLAIHAVLQPLLNTLAFKLSECGIVVSFGIGRAGGSMGYAAIMAVLGTLVEKKGVITVPLCVEAACVLLIALLFITRSSFTGISGSAGSAAGERPESAGAGAAEDDERIDIRSFIRRNKHFFIMNLGVAGLLFSNAVLSNYMPQVAGNVGGTTEQVGRILSLMALAEIPVMLFFDRIRKHFTSRTLIRISALGFAGKITVFRLAGSIGVLFAAQAFQFIAFALLMPAMVYYINEIMSPGEAVKGQALFTMMLTLSTIAASLAGGWILDAYGVRTLTGVSALITAAGAAVVFLTIDKVKSHRRLPQG